ncbi:HD domain-containing phosphohydrolase [Candidatus Nitrospira bockiana]
MENILIVDDEIAIQRMLSRLLEQYGYCCTFASNAKEARERLQDKEFSLVLCDVNMPGESGLDLVRFILAQYPLTAVVMVTGLDNPQLASVALELGAYGYILKPFESNEIVINVANALRRRRLEIENRAHRERLELTVLERTSALRHAIESLERAEKELRLSREETIQRLAIAAEYRDGATAQHIQRMSHYCALLARRHGLDPQHCELIRIASPMHDIGKIGTPDHILLKPGKFTPEEFKAIALHPEIGYRILSGSGAELLNLAATIAWTHHEKFDGSGYPRGLKGSDIPLEGRIAAIADTFDALTSKRVYKPAYPVEQAIDILHKRRAKDFDPELLDTFLEGMDEVLMVRSQYADL